MNKQTTGIHHITSIVGNPQVNVDFYAGVLGLRLIKKTVNFDDPGTYHLYFGNESGQPGTIITFFPWAGASKGKIGDGQVGVTSYAIPTGTMSFWEERLKRFNVTTTTEERFGEESLAFEDPHGLKLELVEREAGEKNPWAFNGVTVDNAIKGFAGATLFSSDPKRTADLLENILELKRSGEERNYARFHSEAPLGNTIDLKTVVTGTGTMGSGTVHHLAWRASDNADQLEWQKEIGENGYGVTPVQDRNYFNAIYFREPGGILFEVATDTPGFSVDESFETMGSRLMLPEQYERFRPQLEQQLLPFEVREIN